MIWKFTQKFECDMYRIVEGDTYEEALENYNAGHCIDKDIEEIYNTPLSEPIEYYGVKEDGSEATTYDEVYDWEYE